MEFQIPHHVLEAEGIEDRVKEIVEETLRYIND